MTEAPASPLDALDRRLLYWLDLDSRQSLRRLSRRLSVSPSRLHYRLAALRKCGYIQTYLTIVDYRLLGYRLYAVHYKLREMDPRQLERLTAALARDPKVLDVLLTEGAFDLQVAFLSMHMDGAAEMLWHLREKLGPHVMEERLLVHLKTHFYPMTALLPEPPEEPIRPLDVMDIHDQPRTLDEPDRRLLVALCNHTDWPVWRIARAANMSGPSAYARMRRLKKQGVILAHRIMISPNLPGFVHYRVFVRMHYMSPERRAELVRVLHQMPQVYRSTFILGDFDLYYDLKAPGADGRRGVMGELNRRFGRDIIRQEWVRVTSTLKFNYFISSLGKK